MFRTVTLLLLAALLSNAAPRVALASDPLAKPCDGAYDWIQLNSAEWLKGDVRRMRNRSIEFKSKKLKSQTLKWKDVVTVCMAGVARFVRSDRSVVQGIGSVRDGRVEVTTALGEVEFDRRDLLAILPGRAREIDRWYFKVSLGGDTNAGNTEQTSLSTALVLRREDYVTRAEVGFYGTYGTANGQANVNRQRTEVKLDYFLTRRLYATLVDATFQYDEFQNIALRATPSAGLGYRLADMNSFEWDVEAALGFQHLRYISVVPGQPPELDDGVIRLSTSFKWTIVNDLKFDVSHDTLVVFTDVGKSTNYTRALLSYEITDLLNLELTAIHNRTWEPVANNQGVLPKKDDLQVIYSLAIEIW